MVSKKQAHEIIKELRLKHNLSQKEMAKMLNMTQQAIALLESGQRKVSYDLVVKIFDILNESLSDFFYQNYYVTTSERNGGEMFYNYVTIPEDKAISLLMDLSGYSIKRTDNDYILTDRYFGKEKKLSTKDYENIKIRIKNYILFMLQEEFL